MSISNNPGQPNFNQPSFNSGGQSGVSGFQQTSALQANALPSGQTTSGMPSQGATIITQLASVLMQQSSASGTDMQTLVRRLLGLPNDFLQTLALLAELGGTQNLLGQQLGKAQQQQLQQLLSQLGTELLGTLTGDQMSKGLQQNIQKALQQLLPLMSGGPQGLDASSKTLKGFQESLQFLTQFSSQLNGSPTDALQTLMALYLPIHPHMAAEPFKAYFGEGEHDPELPTPSEETSQLNLIINTTDIGTFHAVLWLDASEGVNTEDVDPLNGSKTLCCLVRHEQQAVSYLPPFETSFKQHCKAAKLPAVLLAWRASDHLNRENLNTKVLNTVTESPSTKSATDSSDSDTTPSKRVIVYPSSGVPVAVLSAGFFLAHVLLAEPSAQA